MEIVTFIWISYGIMSWDTFCDPRVYCSKVFRWRTNTQTYRSFLFYIPIKIYCKCEFAEFASTYRIQSSSNGFCSELSRKTYSPHSFASSLRGTCEDLCPESAARWLPRAIKPLGQVKYPVQKTKMFILLINVRESITNGFFRISWWKWVRTWRNSVHF